MTRREYLKMTLAEMKKRRWRTTRKLDSGAQSVPAGVEVSVTGKGGGLTINGPRCRCCRVSIYMRKVHHDDVEEIR